MCPLVVELRRKKLVKLIQEFSVEHLAMFIDWLVERGFRTKKFEDLLEVCQKIEPTKFCYNGIENQGYFHHGISTFQLITIKTGSKSGQLLSTGEVRIKKHKPELVPF